MIRHGDTRTVNIINKMPLPVAGYRNLDILTFYYFYGTARLPDSVPETCLNKQINTQFFLKMLRRIRFDSSN